MKFKSPQFLKDITYPDCIYKCSHPGCCHEYCEDKMKDAKAINIVLTLISVIALCAAGFLLMKTFTMSYGG